MRAEEESSSECDSSDDNKHKNCNSCVVVLIVG